MVKRRLKTFRERFITKPRIKSHLTNVAGAMIYFILTAGSANAADTVKNSTSLIGPAATNEGAKETLNAALKFTRSKPALSIATVLVFLFCAPVAGGSASISLSIACVILAINTLK
jgi:hypothetical protein